jgi:hypothetical protein
MRPLTSVAGSGVPVGGGGETGGTTIGGGDTGGTMIGGGEVGGTTIGGGDTGGVTTTAGGEIGGTTVTGGLTGHTGGKKAVAGGVHTANGNPVRVTVTTGSNFFSFFFSLWRPIVLSSITATRWIAPFVPLALINSARQPAPLERFVPNSRPARSAGDPHVGRKCAKDR